MSGKKVAVISSSFPPLGGGGVSSAHYNLSSTLARLGYEVEVFTFLDSEATGEEQGITRHGPNPAANRVLSKLLRVYFTIKRSRGEAYQLHDVFASRAAWRINRDLSRFKPDIAIFPDHGAPLFYVRKLKKTKYIWVAHHNPARFVENPLIGVYSELDAERALVFENRALRKADHVICPSSYMRSVFEDTYEYSGPISVIHNLVDKTIMDRLPGKDVETELGLLPDSKVIYIPSAGSVVKGSDYIFEIVRRLNAELDGSIGFVFSGGGLEKLAEQLDSVESGINYLSLGKLNYWDNISYVKGCTICLSPTLIENLGMALLEAGACGLPIVTFDVGGNSEIVENGTNGYLVPMLDIEQMIEKTLLLFDDDALMEASRNSRKIYEDRFSDEVVGMQYSELFENLQV